MGRQRRTAVGTIGNYFKALVEQALIPDGLQRPPLRLNIIVIVCHVRIVHIRPETDDIGELLPHPLIFPDTLLTFLHERLDAVGFDLILTFDANLLLHFQFHRKSMGIPTGFTRHILAFHGMISRDHVLDHTGQHMPDMRLAVGSRRAVIEGICLSALSLLHALLKNPVLFPEFLRTLFTVNKIQIRLDLIV